MEAVAALFLFYLQGHYGIRPVFVGGVEQVSFQHIESEGFPFQERER